MTSQYKPGFMQICKLKLEFELEKTRTYWRTRELEKHFLELE